MDKYIFDEGNGLWYELIGDYYFPCLTVPTEEEQPVGIWQAVYQRIPPSFIQCLVAQRQTEQLPCRY